MVSGFDSNVVLIRTTKSWDDGSVMRWIATVANRKIRVVELDGDLDETDGQIERSEQQSWELPYSKSFWGGVGRDLLSVNAGESTYFEVSDDLKDIIVENIEAGDGAIYYFEDEETIAPSDSKDFQRLAISVGANPNIQVWIHGEPVFCFSTPSDKIVAIKGSTEEGINLSVVARYSISKYDSESVSYELLLDDLGNYFAKSDRGSGETVFEKIKSRTRESALKKWIAAFGGHMLSVGYGEFPYELIEISRNPVNRLHEITSLFPQGIQISYEDVVTYFFEDGTEAVKRPVIELFSGS